MHAYICIYAERMRNLDRLTVVGENLLHYQKGTLR